MADEGILSRFAGWLRQRIGIAREYTVYQYEVRLSGVVIPPENYTPNKNKKPISEKSLTQWELSFETTETHVRGERGEPPYFRTFTAEPREAELRFREELVLLVRNQEINSQLVLSRSKMEIGAFSWKEEVSIARLPQRMITDYLNSLDEISRAKIEQRGTIKIGSRPHFRIDAFSFEPVDSFKVSADRLKEFTVYDRYYCKLYRPNEDEDFNIWSAEFNHPL